MEAAGPPPVAGRAAPLTHLVGVTAARLAQPQVQPRPQIVAASVARAPDSRSRVRLCLGTSAWRQPSNHDSEPPAFVIWEGRRPTMRNGQFDDPAFLTRLHAGDHAAFRALIRRFHNSLIDVAAAVIGNRAQRGPGRDARAGWSPCPPSSGPPRRTSASSGRLPLPSFSPDEHWREEPCWDVPNPERGVADRQLWDLGHDQQRFHRDGNVSHRFDIM